MLTNARIMIREGKLTNVKYCVIPLLGLVPLSLRVLTPAIVVATQVSDSLAMDSYIMVWHKASSMSQGQRMHCYR